MQNFAVPTLTEKWQRTKFHLSPFLSHGFAEEVGMQNSKNYWQYAADCRRMARGMNAKDSQILLQMAEAWELRAKEAERSEKKKPDGEKR